MVACAVGLAVSQLPRAAGAKKSATRGEPGTVRYRKKEEEVIRGTF